MSRMYALAFAAVLLTVPPGLATAQRGDFTVVGDLVAAPGELVSGMVGIVAGVDEATSISITIVHGAEAGPVVALIGGNHGYDY